MSDCVCVVKILVLPSINIDKMALVEQRLVLEMSPAC